MQRKTLIAIAATIAIVSVPWVITFYDAPFSSKPEDWGVFGDYFGGVLSTIVSIFGFLALLVTIQIQRNVMSMQMDVLEAQWKGIEQDKQTRDDDIYNRQAIQCLEEALTKLTKPNTSEIVRDRVAWLESARLILSAKELSSRITSESMRTVYRVSEKLIRSKFMTTLDPKNCPDTLQAPFFSGQYSDSYIKASNKLEKRSVYTIYKFASWPSEEHDPIDDVETDYSIDPISLGYFGAIEYLRNKT
ncbi:hypothetical protein [Pseudomonas syringae]|uniref:hypothetical protein n=1 Tax=Pseudomonas syringae TaxID=317 RepID=UPI0002ADC930|nr:hypothetical protein [Pseudomonas syringae]ELS43584.1 Hypothetical protein PSSB64_3939 [Pseudomonas syringae pv. syringae B64]